MSLITKALSSGVGRVFTLPGLSIPLILTLGLTLGAVLTVIAISTTLLFQPLSGVANEDKLQVYSINLPFSEKFILPFLNMKRLAHFNDDFAELGEWATISTQATKVSINNIQYQVNNHFASNNILKVLGSNLIKGHDVTIDSPEQLVWISDSFWQTAFSGQESALGSTISLQEKSYTIVGIIEDVAAIKSTGIVNLNQIWTIKDLAQAKTTAESKSINGHIQNIIYLPKGNKIVDEKEINQWVEQYVEKNFTADAAAFFDFQLMINKTSYRDNLLGSATSLITTLTIAVMGLLLMAALNLLNLFIAHYQARSKEFSMQLSLGARLNKLRLMIFLENIPCFSLAAITGVLAAAWIIKLLPILAGNNLPLLTSIKLNFITLCAAVLILLTLALIFSLLATIDVNKQHLMANLNGSGKGTQQQSNKKISKVLMVLQLALASILLSASVMLALQSYQEVYSDKGYTLGNSYEVSMEAVDKEWKKNTPSNINGNTLNSQVIEIMNFIESTVNDSQVIAPSSGPIGNSFSVRNYTDEETNQNISYQMKYFNERYFSAFNIRFLAGKNLTKSQIDNGDPSAIIDASMAKLIYPKLSYDEIIGKELKNTTVPVLIQGIVPTLRSHLGSSKENQLPLVYRPKAHLANDLTYTVMMPAGQTLTAAMLSDKFKQQFPLFKNLKVDSLHDTWSEMTQTHRISLWLIIAVTLLTLLLATIGVSGLTQMTTNQKKYELAVRMATGAKQSLLVQLILKDALWMLTLGLGLGFAISVIGYQQLQNHVAMLPDLNGLAMITLDFALIIIMLLSVIIPAWRVIRADPMQTLRED
jgi:predicted permease